jgi:superfamily II DNA or RNA helicase
VRGFEDYFESIRGKPTTQGWEFEKALKRWFSNDQEWQGFFEEVFLWNEWPLAKTRDIGIDLVAKDKIGGYWAIQAKAYDPESALKKSDIDSFISSSSKSIFSGRILVTTSKILGPNLRATLSGQDKETRVITWSDLVTSEFDWSAESQNHQIEKALWPHQLSAIEKIKQLLPEKRRGQLIMACGTGKTLTSIRIAESLESQLTLVMVPSISLISQAISDWSRDSREAFSWWAVCSDETVGSKEETEKFYAFDLSKPSSTDEAELVKFLKTNGKKVIFSTYHSSNVVARALQNAGTTANLAIFDEAHRLAGRVSKSFTALLDDSLPIQMRLFQTATPRLFKQYNLKSEPEDVALSMDEESIFGEVLYRYSFAQAIKDGNLRDFKVVIFVVTNEMLKEEIDNRELSKLGEKVIDFKDLAINFGVIKAMVKHDLRRTITFHSRVKWASNFSESQRMLWHELSAPSTQLETFTLSGENSASQRKSKLAILKSADKNRFVQVTNARCLAEGVDVPDLDGVVFVDPKASKVDITQAVGRAIRKGSGRREFGYVVIPIFLTEEEVSEGVIDSAAFASTLEVLGALKAHDEDFESLLTRTRLGTLKASQSRNYLPKILIDSPRSLPNHFHEKVQTAILEGVTSGWYGNYLNLKRLVAGGLNVRTDLGRLGSHKSLTSWVSTQRQAYADGRLDVERIELLEAIPNWFWNERQIFDEAFAEFISYLKTGGILLPPEELVNRASGGKMRNFARQVQTKYVDPLSNGELTSDQRLSLDSIDSWREFTSVSVAHEFSIRGCDGETYEINVPRAPTTAWPQSWRAMLSYLSAVESYSIANNHFCFPETVDSKRYYFDGVGVSYYRYKIEKGELPRYILDVLSQLQKIPDCRKIPKPSIPNDNPETADGDFWYDDRWEKSFIAFSNYFTETGISAPSAGTKRDGINIATWISSQRGLYTGTFTRHENVVSDERRQRLESLPGFTWEIPNDQTGGFRKWKKTFELVRAFENAEGHTNFVQRRDPNLYSWGRKQRDKYKKGELSEVKIVLLESLKTWEWN